MPTIVTPIVDFQIRARLDAMLVIVARGRQETSEEGEDPMKENTLSKNHGVGRGRKRDGTKGASG